MRTSTIAACRLVAILASRLGDVVCMVRHALFTSCSCKYFKAGALDECVFGLLHHIVFAPSFFFCRLSPRWRLLCMHTLVTASHSCDQGLGTRSYHHAAFNSR